MRNRRTGRQGMALAATLVIVLLVAGMTTALLVMVLAGHRMAEKAHYKTSATYLAEAAVEQGAHLLRTGYANEILPPPPLPPTGTISIAGTSMTYSWNTGVLPYQYTLSSSVTIDKKSIPFTATQYNIVPPPMINGELSTAKALFEIQVTMRVQQALGLVIRTVEVNITPLFQFLAFYNGELEFLPGPAWVGRGRIHTNSDLYIGAGASLDLDTDYVRAVGHMLRHRKDNGASLQ